MATSVGTIKVDATLSTGSFIKNLNGLEAAANKAVSNIAKSLSSSQATFTSIGKSLPESISAGVNNAAKAIRNLPSVIANSVKSIPNTVSTAVRSAGNAFNNLPGTAARAIGNVVSSAQRELPKIAKAAEDAAKKIGSSLTNAAKIGIGAFTAATAAITGQATKAYSDYQQLTGGVAKLFGDSAGIVEANAQQAFKTAGVSANQYMESVTSFSASLISGLGGNTAEAASLADQAIRDMSDNANTFGTSMDSIMYTYQGFAKQNYTMLDNLKLGYGGTQAEMARLINDSGVLGDTMTVTAENVNSVSFDKIIEAIHVVQERMNITGTTANEAASTVEGSINSMKGSWTNLLTALGSGEGVDDAMKTFMSSLEGVAKNIAPVISSILSGIVQAIPTLLPQLVTQLTTMIQSLAQQLPAMLQQLILAITNPSVIQSVLNAGLSLITSLLSVFSDPTTIGAMVNASIQLLMGLIEAIPTIVEAFTAAIPTIIDVLTKPETLAQMAVAAGKLMMAIVESVPTILGALIQAFGNLVNNLWQGIKGLFSSIGQKIGDTVSGAIKGVINGALSLLEGFLNGPIDLINGALDLINALPGVNVGKISRIKLPRMATGGYVGGVGTATSDSNPTLLSRGEYVVNANTVKALGVDFMDALNNGKIGVGSGSAVTNNYYQFDQRANNRWMYEQIRTGAAA